jgi:hypothetical protein
MLNSPQPGKFVQLSSDLLSSGYSVRFRASGASMQPAIWHGDVLTIGPVAPSSITPGSVAVYRRFNRLLAHRVVRIEADDSGAPVFVLRGDSASDCDAPVAAWQMLGEVVKVERRTSAIRRHAGMCLQRLVRAGLVPAGTMTATSAVLNGRLRKLVPASVTAAALLVLASFAQTIPSASAGTVPDRSQFIRATSDQFCAPDVLFQHTGKSRRTAILKNQACFRA